MSTTEEQRVRRCAEKNAAGYGWCACSAPTRLSPRASFCSTCDRVIPLAYGIGPLQRSTDPPFDFDAQAPAASEPTTKKKEKAKERKPYAPPTLTRLGAPRRPAFSRFCAAHLDEAARLAEIPRLYPFDELRPEEVAKLRRVFQIMWTTTKRDMAKVTCMQVEREQAAAEYEVRLQKLLESESAEAETAEAVDAPYEDE